MAGQKSRITVPGRFRLYVAPVGTVAPADAVVVMPTGWTDVGYTTRDGSSFSTDPSYGKVESHQSDYFTRKFVESFAAMVECDLQEWSRENFITVHGGGTVTTVGATTPATYKYTPPEGVVASRSLCLELIDGTVSYRYIIPSASPSEGVENSLSRTEESVLPLRYEVEGQDGVASWYLVTNSAAFAPAT